MYFCLWLVLVSVLAFRHCLVDTARVQIVCGSLSHFSIEHVVLCLFFLAMLWLRYVCHITCNTEMLALLEAFALLQFLGVFSLVKALFDFHQLTYSVTLT